MGAIPPATEERAYRDRYPALVCFGVLEILLGLLALVGVGSMILASALAHGSALGMAPKALGPAIAPYLAAAVFFVWMGVGSILARRWARALVLISSWMWLGCGLIGIATLVLFFPSMRAQMSGSLAGPPGSPSPLSAADTTHIASVAEGCVLAVLALLSVALPLALALFYGSRHVKATCEARDPRPRWTDRCPLPALGLSLLHGTGALSLLVLALGYRVFPIFGVILSGWHALVASLAFSLLLAGMARATYHLRAWAWWAAGCLWCFSALSSAVMFLRPFDWEDFYRQMGFPAQQYEQMGLGQFWVQRQALWISGISFLAMFTYLLWARRFFFSSGRGLAPGAKVSASDIMSGGGR